jgi:hypothetical protein
MVTLLESLETWRECADLAFQNSLVHYTDAECSYAMSRPEMVGAWEVLLSLPRSRILGFLCSC